MSTLALQKNHLVPSASFLSRVLDSLEKFRVRNHLRIVEGELKRRDVSTLSPALREERSKNIARLHEYWTGDIFPKNTDFSDKYMPYFKDASGTPCAMAYLIEQSGYQDLVNAVSRQNNHIFIDDIKDGPVVDWVHNSGLSQAEAARVQPSYGPGCSGIGNCSGYVAPLSNSLHVPYWIFYAVAFIVLELFASYVSSWIAAGNRKRRIVTFVFFTIINLALLGLAFTFFGQFSNYYY